MQLEQEVDTLNGEMAKRDKLIDECRGEYEALSVKYNAYKEQCERALLEQLGLKYEKELNDKLNQVFLLLLLLPCDTV